MRLAFARISPPSFLLLGCQITSYHRHFSDKVHRFAERNRFNMGNINRDKYVNCYMQVGIEVTLAADGSVKNLSVKEPSLVPMVDKYFSYLINQSAPFDPLNRYIGNDLDELTFTERFRLALNLYEYSKVTKPCT